MNEDQILKWMRDKVKTEGFTDAASLAQGFLESHGTIDVNDPDFTRTLDAGFKIAQEIHGF